MAIVGRTTTLTLQKPLRSPVNGCRRPVHVVDRNRAVQCREQPAQPLRLIRSDAPRPPRFEELPQTFVAEALDRHYVACNVTDYKLTFQNSWQSLTIRLALGGV